VCKEVQVQRLFSPRFLLRLLASHVIDMLRQDVDVTPALPMRHYVICRHRCRHCHAPPMLFSSRHSPLFFHIFHLYIMTFYYCPPFVVYAIFLSFS
jgi:hypothetical protein